MMFTFDTRIKGIPCQCRVDSYTPGRPMRVYGPGMGDADPPEGAEFEYTILDRSGHEASWLQNQITDAMEQELFEEFELEYKYEYYNPY